MLTDDAFYSNYLYQIIISSSPPHSKMTTIKEAMYFTGPEPGFVKGGVDLNSLKNGAI